MHLRIRGLFSVQGGRKLSVILRRGFNLMIVVDGECNPSRDRFLHSVLCLDEKQGRNLQYRTQGSVLHSSTSLVSLDHARSKISPRFHVGHILMCGA